ncbi:hypothetical protein [Paenibacillus gallinarum]|uniref:Uncharacterized protein n=1 Tax=Paenibacillus gallinarum TaxID=2762232 RepID=A0ABR8T3Q5_9BACL|nr:hypothetical protein [Paenibacillus gallinarum]MBD7970398.1 hypothetical protein [Paenibacillus gallinarum]
MTLYTKRPGVLAACVGGNWYLIEDQKAWKSICSFTPSQLGKKHRLNSNTYKNATTALKRIHVAI